MMAALLQCQMGYAAGDLDCCVDILINVAQRLRESEEVSHEELASAAMSVSDALTKEVCCSRKSFWLATS